MNKALKNIIKAVVPQPILRKFVLQPLIAYRSLRPIAPRKCNICDYEGYFGIKGRPARLDARCPKCNSLERHRLMMLAFDRGDIALDIKDDDQVLHFAAEPILEKRFREKWKNYRTADLFQDADLKLNLEDIDLPNDSINLIVANHVLEHVDDIKVAHELHRILANGGVLVCMVPIVEGWEQTYENKSVKSEEERWLHFGQGDHVRYYGRDFRARIASGGLRLVGEVTAEGADVIEYGLSRGEKVFVFQKP